VPRDPVLATTKAVSWAELLKHNFIALQRPSSMRRLLEESLAGKGMELRVALECHRVATASRLVAAGAGVSVISSLLRSQVTALGARCVRQRVGMIVRGDQQLSAAAAALRGMLRDAFAQGIEEGGAVV
jgi:LysR family carnitine catabolism transcriptional activator